MNGFIKGVLEKVFDNFDKFYLHVLPHPQLVIGNRGLVDEEQEKGLLLVFGPYSYKDFQWDDDFIYVSMRFSGKWENLVIPFDAIISVFDDPLIPTFVFSFNPKREGTEKKEEKSEPKIEKGDKIIKIDFKGKEK